MKKTLTPKERAKKWAIKKDKDQNNLISLNYSWGKGDSKDFDGKTNEACNTRHFKCENFTYKECLEKITEIEWEDEKNKRFVKATHVSTGRNHFVRNAIVIDIDEKQYHYSTDRKKAEKEILKECIDKIGSKPFGITYALKNRKIDKSVQIMFLIKETKHVEGFDKRHYLDVMRYFCSLFEADPLMTNWKCKNPFYEGLDIKGRKQVGIIFKDSKELDIHNFLSLIPKKETPQKTKKGKGKSKKEKPAKDKFSWREYIEDMTSDIVWENDKIKDGRKRYLKAQITYDFFTSKIKSDYLYCNEKFIVPFSKGDIYEITDKTKKFLQTRYKNKSQKNRDKSLATRKLLSFSKEVNIIRLKKQGFNNTQIAKKLGITRLTVIRILNERKRKGLSTNSWG